MPGWLQIVVVVVLFVTTVLLGCVLGSVLAYVTLRCRSLWPAVILHYLNNLSYYARWSAGRTRGHCAVTV